MKSIIFDMDGVIADTEPLHEKVWRNFFKSHGVEVTRNDLRNMKGKSGVAVVKMFLPNITSNNEAQRLRDERAKLFLEELEHNIKEVIGFTNFFSELKKRSIKIAVATSAEESRAKLILKKIGVLNEINALVTTKDVINGKPCPDIFLIAAKQLNSKPRECIVFEDSRSGIQAAQSANMTPVLIMTTHRKNEFDNIEYAFNDFTEINLDELLGS